MEPMCLRDKQAAGTPEPERLHECMANRPVNDSKISNTGTQGGEFIASTVAASPEYEIIKSM